MFIGAWGKQGDYNRHLPAPIRWLRQSLAAAAAPFRPLWLWAGDGWRRHWARPLLLGFAAIVLLWPVDAWLLNTIAGWRDPLPGDLVRELHALQQFGQGGSIILVALVVLSLDPRAPRRLLDWAAALALTAAAVYPLKMLLGRPRPGLGSAIPDATFNTLYTADTFLGPFGQHPFDPPVGLRHAWEFWGGISADLWSMPSAHTAYAVVMAVFLSASYPRLTWLAWTLAALVAFARVLFAAHYPTDVAAGAALGAAMAVLAVRTNLGQRLLTPSRTPV